MKKLTGVMVIVSMLVFCSATVFAADANSDLLEKFSAEVEGIHQGLEDISEVIGEALEDNELQESALINAIKGIEERAHTLVDLAKKHNQQWQSEIEGIVDFSEDLKADLAEQEFGEIVTTVVRIAKSLNNMEIMFPQYLRDEMERRSQELKNAIARGAADWEEIESTVEDIIIYSRQLNIAADAFGKKIWKKFTKQLWTICMELDEAAEEENEAEIEVLLKEMEDPLKMLAKLIQ